MPLPKPREGEEQNEFISRCIEFETKAAPDRPPEQIQIMCYEAWRNRKEALGQGRGVGGQRQGIGGAEYCVCPKCDYAIKHERDIPCQQIKCPKCGSYMKGTNENPKEGEMTKEVRESVRDFTYEISFKEATFEAEGPAIRNVVLLGAESANKRKYEREAMRNAVPLYEGIQAFLNHPTPDEEKMGSRDVRLLAGCYANVRFDESDLKIRGDFIGLANDQSSQKYLSIAQAAPHLAGNSHNAQGKIHTEGGIEIVEEIKKVFSVDLVSNPATTKGMFETTKNKETKKGVNKMEYGEVTMVGLKEERPDLVEALQTEGQKSRDEEMKKITDERDKAVKEADELKVKEALRGKETLINKLLDEGELPDEAKTVIFRKSLMSLKPAKEGETIEVQAKEMIEDRLAAIKDTGVKNNTEKHSSTKEEAKITAEEAASELKD